MKPRANVCFLLLPALFALAGSCLAEPQAGPGYLLRTIDGDQDVGEHFALAERPSGGWTAFFYLADEGRLVASSCLGATCSGAISVSNPGHDRGRHVSAATRPALSNRPLAAYYDAGSGGLFALDCLSSECSFATERALDVSGDVGQDTAIAVDPATGLAAISYYDADNGDLKLYRCASAACDAGTAIVVDASGDRGGNSSLAFAGGRLWIAHEDRGTGELLLASAAPPYDSFSSVSLGAGAEPALKPDANGLLDMVWRNRTDDSLARLRCLDVPCLAAVQTTLAGSGRGHRPSATRTPSGQLLVSHLDEVNGALLGTLCADAACATPQLLQFDTDAAIGGRSVVGMLSAGRPVVFYHDLTGADVRSARCVSAACDSYVRTVAFNGLPVGNVRLAMRPDGVPVLAYIRQRRPWLALCADRACSSVTRRALPAFNSDARPALAVRADQRPFAYVASVGGSQAYDCSDPACTDGNLREVSGSGNSTSEVIEMALRADGRPVLLYTTSNLNDVHLFVCADVACSSGTQRLLVDEPSTGSTFLLSPAVIVGPGDRPIVMYSLSTDGIGQLRFVRCDDSACSSATARTIGSEANFFGMPLALRDDGRVAFIESSFSSHRLGICNDLDCTALTRHPLPGSGRVQSMALLGGNRPVFESTSGALGLITTCDDASCSSAQSSTVVSHPAAGISYSGSLAVGVDAAVFVAFEEQSRGDMLLAVPRAERVFRHGFEQHSIALNVNAR
jgi:hypothetical protein